MPSTAMPSTAMPSTTHSLRDFSDLVAAVSAQTEVPAKQLLSGDRLPTVPTTARTLVWALLRVTGGLSLAEIGHLYGRDETSIQTALYRLGDRLPQEPDLAGDYLALLKGRKIRCHLLNAVHTARLVEKLKRHQERPSGMIASDHLGKSTHGKVAELNETAVRRSLAEAEEQLTYWQGARFRASREQDRAAAGARVQLWEMHVAALHRRLRELARTATLTA